MCLCGSTVCLGTGTCATVTQPATQALTVAYWNGVSNAASTGSGALGFIQSYIATLLTFTKETTLSVLRIKK